MENNAAGGEKKLKEWKKGVVEVEAECSVVETFHCGVQPSSSTATHTYPLIYVFILGTPELFRLIFNPGFL